MHLVCCRSPRTITLVGALDAISDAVQCDQVRSWTHNARFFLENGGEKSVPVSVGVTNTPVKSTNLKAKGERDTAVSVVVRISSDWVVIAISANCVDSTAAPEAVVAVEVANDVKHKNRHW